MARQSMTALEWVWYMPPNIEASSAEECKAEAAAQDGQGDANL